MKRRWGLCEIRAPKFSSDSFASLRPLRPKVAQASAFSIPPERLVVSDVSNLVVGCPFGEGLALLLIRYIHVDGAITRGHLPVHLVDDLRDDAIGF
jgi:hypothetical protein